MKITALVVLYNKKISESKSIMNLKNYIDILVLDNSEQNLDNEIEAKKMNLNYLSMNGNIGLSKAYNKGINFLKNKTDYILLCDDDTNITKEYINELKNLIKNQYDCIIPQIINEYDHKICSPKCYNNCSLFSKIYEKGKKFKNIKAINSGLCINMKCFDFFSYNENNFLYFVDVNFCEDCLNKNKLNYKVANTKIYQNFSQFEKFDDNKINQMKLRLKDSKNYNTKTIHFLYKYAFILQMLIIHKNIKILKLIKE